MAQYDHFDDFKCYIYFKKALNQSMAATEQNATYYGHAMGNRSSWSKDYNRRDGSKDDKNAAKGRTTTTAGRTYPSLGTDPTRMTITTTKSNRTSPTAGMPIVILDIKPLPMAHLEF